MARNRPRRSLSSAVRWGRISASSSLASKPPSSPQPRPRSPATPKTRNSPRSRRFRRFRRFRRPQKWCIFPKRHRIRPNGRWALSTTRSSGNFSHCSSPPRLTLLAAIPSLSALLRLRLLRSQPRQHSDAASISGSSVSFAVLSARTTLPCLNPTTLSR